VRNRTGSRGPGPGPRGRRRTSAPTMAGLRGCRAASFRRAYTAEPVSGFRSATVTPSRSWRMRPAASCTLHVTFSAHGSAAGGSIQIGSEALIALIIAAQPLQVRPSAAGSGGMVRMVLGVLCTVLPVSRASAHKLASPHRSIYDSVTHLFTNPRHCAECQVGGARAPRRPASAGLCAIPQA
jgi:hypothetical protein